MTGEETAGQVPGQPSTTAGEAGKGTEGQGALPEEGDVQTQLSALKQELADQKAQAALQARQMQGKIDKDIARERTQAEQRTKSLQAYVREKMEKAGASLEELATFEADFGSETERLSDKEKAARYEDLVADQAVEVRVREYQDTFIAELAEVVGIEIDPHHPDIKRGFEDSPEDFKDSVKVLAKKLVEGKGKDEDQESLTEAAKRGAIGSLGGGTGTATNPLAGMTDPDEIHDEWVRQGRPMPKREEA